MNTAGPQEAATDLPRTLTSQNASGTFSRSASLPNPKQGQSHLVFRVGEDDRWQLPLCEHHISSGPGNIQIRQPPASRPRAERVHTGAVVCVCAVPTFFKASNVPPTLCLKEIPPRPRATGTGRKTSPPPAASKLRLGSCLLGLACGRNGLFQNKLCDYLVNHTSYVCG